MNNDIDNILSPDNEDSITDSDAKCMEMLNRLLSFTLPAKNPRLQLTAFAYVCGVDLTYILNCSENTEVSVAKSIGETQQCFHAAVMVVSELYNIKYRQQKPKNKRDK